MKTTTLVTTLLIGCLAGTAQATTAVTAEKVRREVVNYADLDLESKSGAETLLHRIKFASRRVCGLNDAGVMAIEFRAQRYRCAEQATARAVADIDARSVVVANAR
jgi:UrcA family protein